MRMQVFAYKCVLFIVFLFKKSQPALRGAKQKPSLVGPAWLELISEPKQSWWNPTVQEAEPSKSVAAAFQAEEVLQLPAFSGLGDQEVALNIQKGFLQNLV